MRSINKVILIGNLTRDPELRTTPNGQSVATFGLATNRQWVTKGNDKKSSAEFHECVAWARLADISATYLKKGALIYVEGYLKTRSWETPEGIKKFKTEIVMQDMIMLDKKDAEENDYLPSDVEQDYSAEMEETKEDAPQATTPEPSTEKPSEEEPTKETPKSVDQIDIDKDLGL